MRYVSTSRTVIARRAGTVSSGSEAMEGLDVHIVVMVDERDKPGHLLSVDVA